MKILVAGGCGFIGSNFVKRLLSDGYEVYVIDDLSRGSLEKLDEYRNHPRLTFFKVDITGEEVFDIQAKFDVVVDFVAYKIPRYSSGLKTLTVNTKGAENLLKIAARDSAKFIMASTSDVYGKSQEFPYGEGGDLVLGPSYSRRWAYAVSKIFNEHMVFAYHDEYGIPFVILRFFGAYGPHQHLDWWGGPVGVFLSNIYKGLPVSIHGDGTQKRTFMYIDDLIEGILRAMKFKDAENEIINIGSSEEISILDLARLIHRLSYPENELKLEFISYESFGNYYEDPKRRIGSYVKMKDILQYVPHYALEEGLKKFIEWFKNRVERGTAV
ncbi:MAG: NAD-dependent epimerase/dehydratase family protein [Candidatus Hydrothermia bacterium]|nr:NAD-dependent epimerase/dehydratase family protein [Candidatus Hydrothermia bacterium]MDD5572663.1 NAD-dependent epimerase/dehydratase family protein [Candidatus Hydrothermia bacterium]